jgi:hypothetical protein
MGVAFIQRTPEQHQEVEKFIHTLMESNGAIPELLVEPEGLESISPPVVEELAEGLKVDSVEDPLLELFEHKADLPTADFLNELRKQRRSESVDEPETILPA